MELFLDCLKDAFFDTLKLLPLLFLTYLLMEYIEHKGNEKMEAVIQRSGRLGPLAGAFLGLVPQCGFAGAAAGFFSSRMITPGTLFAIFLSTSDEMLPLMIASAAPASTILHILGAKLIIAIVLGFLLDLFLAGKRQFVQDHVCAMCEREHCGCEEHGILRAAINHSLRISLFILLISLTLNLLIELAGLSRISGAFLSSPLWGTVITALVGLIPNCTPSLIITTFYLQGVLSGGAMMAGLLTNAGMGLLVLYRTNPSWKENLCFTALLYFAGVIIGLLTNLMGIVF